MLDHFRSLSHEANMLETNNHTLESRAMETKTQLSMAMDQITDLENKVEQQEIMNRDYEKQVTGHTYICTEGIFIIGKKKYSI